MKELFDLIKETDSSGVITEYSELLFDEIMDDGLLKNELLKKIPVVSTAISICKTGTYIRDRLLIIKLKVFLTSLSETTTHQRQEFIEKYEKQSRKIGEELILYIDRLDHIEKPEYVAKLFANYLYEEIDFREFSRLCQIIDRCYIEDLKYLKEYQKCEMLSGIEAESLANNGLVTMASIDGGTPAQDDDNSGIEYKINKLGKLLIKYAF